MQIRELELARRWPAKPFVLLMAGLAAVLAFPHLSLGAAAFAVRNLVLVAPAIIVGVGLAAAVTASGSMAMIASAFRGREPRMIALAAFIGALTPVCGVSVLPLVAGLLAAPVPLAPIMAFWLSSPITGPAMLAITAATLGMPFAVGKTLAAFLIGVFGGCAVLALTRAGHLHRPERGSAPLRRARAAACTTGSGGRVNWRFWTEPSRRKVFRDVSRDTLRLITIWLSVAFVAEYVLKLYLPADLIVQVAGRDSPWAVPLAATVGTPIYLDGYAALPLIRGLIETGMREDAAMAFLVAGGITSAWAAIPIFALVRLPVFAVYLVLAVISAMLAGWGYGLYTG